jgi:hypothetical protein
MNDAIIESAERVLYKLTGILKIKRKLINYN